MKLIKKLSNLGDGQIAVIFSLGWLMCMVFLGTIGITIDEHWDTLISCIICLTCQIIAIVGMLWLLYLILKARLEKRKIND